MNNDFNTNVKEYEEVASWLSPYRYEWIFAIKSGWNSEEFFDLYRSYIYSTQIKLSKNSDNVNQKGKPAEYLLRYFLSRGGFVYSINSINVRNAYQIDGQGIINRTSVSHCMGEYFCRKFGIDIFLESKNLNQSVGIDALNIHCSRMSDLDCSVGVLFSALGFKLGSKYGISEKLYLNIHKHNMYNLILSSYNMYQVFEYDKPPLMILSESLSLAKNNQLNGYLKR